jgi:cobalt-zinc-cadmium efflux system protein
LLETAPKGMNIDDISAQLKANIPEITQITDMHIWQITTNIYNLTAHIEINTTDCIQSKQILNKINQLLHERYNINYTTIQLEHKIQ